MRSWRLVGPNELRKIEALDMRAFPPRLPDQPIFYPVLSFDYAEKIARDWNSTREDQDYRGFVTAFAVDDAFAAQFEPQEVGGRDHRELWAPAERLASFNAAIDGAIAVEAAYVGGARLDFVALLARMRSIDNQDAHHFRAIARRRERATLVHGESARLRADAPERCRAFREGVAVGMRPVESENVAASFQTIVGDVLYVIERGDGQDCEVPGAYLEKDG